MTHTTLIDLWYILTASILFLYVGLSGIDLGVCLLSLFAEQQESETMLASIDGIWHSNQTWLVVLGAILFGAFPGVYADILPRLYGMIVLLLAALTVRGLGLEYRHEATNQQMWRRLAGWGAVGIIVVEGLMLAVLLSGLPYRNGQLSILSDFWLPANFPILLFLFFCALLTGGAWLRQHKSATPLPLSLHFRTLSVWAVLAGALGVILLSTHICHRLIVFKKMDSSSLIGFYLPLAAVGLADSMLLLASMSKKWQGSSLPWALILVGTALAACAATLHPPLSTPQAISTMTALAATPDALIFLSCAAGLLLPPLLAFQIFQYRLQRRHNEQDPSDKTSMDHA